MNSVERKHIVLGVSGSIAAYKIVELARNLTLDGAIVDVIMTEAAERFVGTATFQALTGRPVLTSMWSLPEDGVIGHVSLGQHADLVVLAPATANTIARLAAGLSDDLLTTTVLATTAPILCVPAMNPHMYANAATQENIATLRRRGMTILEPAYGRMAEPMIGKGRMPEVAVIDGELRALLGRTSGPMRGRRVVVTAAGTHEPIDPVRFVANGSSGRQGYALAAAARDRGAHVTLISGPSALPPPTAVKFVSVTTALQMQQAVNAALERADLLLMAAAVADFRPADQATQKIKKGDDEELMLRLVRNPDILGTLAARRDVVKVGFAAETEQLYENARAKLERKGLDMIVANEAVASIGQVESQVTLIDTEGVWPLPRQLKDQTAATILDEILRRFPDRLGPASANDER
jgi:phosphopantothenoylcysteine decarboxylase/phosphopantothenate--cysteine ligase